MGCARLKLITYVPFLPPRLSRDFAPPLPDRTNALETRQGETHAAIHELDQLRTELTALRATSAAAELSRQEQRQQTAGEVQRLAEREEARQETARVREDAARLSGQLTAHHEQMAALLVRLAPPTESSPKPKGRSGQKGTGNRET